MHQSVSAVFQTCTRKIIKFEKNTERKGRKREKKTYTVFVAVGGEQIAVPYCWKNVRRVIHDIKRGDNKWKNKYKKNCAWTFIVVLHLIGFSKIYFKLRIILRVMWV